MNADKSEDESAPNLQGQRHPTNIESESKDVQGAYKRLIGTDGLKDAFSAAVAAGMSGQAIADSLFEQNQAWGKTSREGEPKPLDPAVISRMRKALAYLE